LKIMQADSPKTSGYLILIVDDDESMRMLKREILERLGFRVVEAENGRDGVEIAIREQPRLILMNYLMPVMDGLKATEEIRRQPGLEKVPILMNSSCSKEEMRDAALLAGCNDYLEEPYRPRKLVEKVQSYVLIG
jgi:CheY-like chemotaxis protein